MPRYTPGIVKVMGELSLSFSVLPPKFDHVIFSLAAKFHLSFDLKKRFNFALSWAEEQNWSLENHQFLISQSRSKSINRRNL
jgi:hypothetical protein